MVLNTDLTVPSQQVTIDRNSFEELMVSRTSPMPAGLFNRMTKAEVRDFIAYLIGGGDSGHEYFRKEGINQAFTSVSVAEVA